MSGTEDFIYDPMEWDYYNESDNFHFEYSLLQHAYTQSQSQSQDEEEWSYTFEDEETETVTSIDNNRKQQKHFYIIPHDEIIKKTPCAIVVYDDYGKPSRCGVEDVDKKLKRHQRGLSQLFGT